MAAGVHFNIPASVPSGMSTENPQVFLLDSKVLLDSKELPLESALEFLQDFFTAFPQVVSSGNSPRVPSEIPSRNPPGAPSWNTLKHP